MNTRVLRLPTGVVLVSLLVGCGVHPRNPKGIPMKPVVQIEEMKATETAGLFWSIREARVRQEGHPHSSWIVGQSLELAPLVQGSRVAIAEALPWPDEPQSILLVQFRNLREGDWSARCIRPDDSLEESIPTRRLDYDPEIQSGVISLEEVFGPRGQRRDPATTCHLLLRFEKEGEPRSLEFAIRVLAGLPAPEPVERQDHGLTVEGVIREETWRNDSLRTLRLSLDAQSSLEVSTWMDSQRFVNNGKTDIPGNVPIDTYYSVGLKTEVLARYELDSHWSSWSPVPVTVRWPAGSKIRVEYRLAPAAGAPVCSREDRIEQVIPWSNVKVIRRFRVIARHFRGEIDWKAGVLERAKVRGGGAVRQSEGSQIQEFLEPKPEIRSSAFDCQGWVP